MSRGHRLAGAVGFLLAAVLSFVVFVWTRFGQVVDAASFLVSGLVSDTPVAAAATVLRSGLVVVAAIGALVLGAGALLRRRWRPVLAGVVLVGGSVAAARILRAALPRPFLGDYAYPENTSPSGHAAAAASLLVALIWLVPPPRRQPAMAWVAVVLITLAGWSSILTFAHRASDVWCALLLVGAGATLLAPRAPASASTRLRLAGLPARLLLAGFGLAVVTYTAMAIWGPTLLAEFVGPLLLIFVCAVLLVAGAGRAESGG